MLRCTLELDNRATDHRLRLRVPSGVPGVPAVAGGPFGSVDAAGGRRGRRPLSARDAGDHRAGPPLRRGRLGRPRAGAPGARLLRVRARARRRLRLTLLRCVGQLSRGDLPTRPGHAGWPTADAGGAVPRRRAAQLAVAPVGAAELQAGARSRSCGRTSSCRRGRSGCARRRRSRPPDVDVRLEGDGLVFSALKPAGGARRAGAALLQRARRSRWTGCWRLGRPAARAERVRADERGAPDARRWPTAGARSRSVRRPGIVTIW